VKIEINIEERNLTWGVIWRGNFGGILGALEC
jgi:hypothetical protein